MKHFLGIIAVSVVAANTFSQTSTIDTFRVVNREFVSLNEAKKPFSLKLKDKTIFIKKNSLSIDDIEIRKLLDKFPYCMVYDKKGNLIEKGQWFLEGFSGDYKSFYKDGKLKSEGQYEFGNKIGEWKYYNQEGKVVREGTFTKPTP
jgi:hypothetical protein